MARNSAGDGSRRLPPAPLVAFVGWGLGLSILQSVAERTSTVQALTAGLAYLVWRTLLLLGVSTQIDGTVLGALGTSQEVTPNCFGFVAIVIYSAAVLATPASWRSRARGLAFGLGWLIVINLFRLLTLLSLPAMLLALVPLPAIWIAVFRFGHVAVWGGLTPIVLLATWGLWVVRELRPLPAYPRRFLLRALIAFPFLLAAWYYAVDRYLVGVADLVNTALTAAGLQVRSVSLVRLDLYRFIDVAFADGGLRLELAAVSVTLVALLALVVASTASWSRRLAAGLAGVAALFVLHALGTAGLLLAARTVPIVTPPLEAFNEFLNLAAPGVLWLYLLGERSLA